MGIKPFPEWQTTTESGIEHNYLRIGSMLRHTAMLELNHLAFRIYIYMLYYCGGNYEFEFSYSKFKGFASKKGFQESLSELVAAGLITVAQRNKNLRKPNRYRFSTKWRSTPSDGGNISD